MKRHVIIGRLGTNDRLVIPVSGDEIATRPDLAAAKKRFDYGIGRAMEDLAKMGIFPTEIGLDLLIHFQPLICIFQDRLRNDVIENFERDSRCFE